MAYVDVSVHGGESSSEAFERRRKELEAGWQFKCACARCIEEGKDFDAGNAGEAVPLEGPPKEAHSMEASDVVTVERDVEAEQ